MSFDMASNDLENGTAALNPPPASSGPDESGCSSSTSSAPAPASKDRSEELPGLPRLNYKLLDHKKKLFLVGGLLVLEGSILPLVLFYPLWYATTLRHGIRKYPVFRIPSSAPVTIEIVSDQMNNKYAKPNCLRI